MWGLLFPRKTSFSLEQIDRAFFQLHVEEKLSCHPQFKNNLIASLNSSSEKFL